MASTNGSATPSLRIGSAPAEHLPGDHAGAAYWTQVALPLSARTATVGLFIPRGVRANMVDQDNVWYRLGYALERVRERLPRADRLRTLEERQATRRVGAARRSRPGQWPPHRRSPTGESWEAVLTAAATALLGRALGTMPRKPGVVRFLRAGAAGVGAALLRELLRSLGPGERPCPPLAQLVQDAALTGSARGLVYGALVEPFLYGPPVVRGTAYGSLEYVVSPWGGLTNLVGAHAPHRKVPFLADLLDDLGPRDDTLIDHVLFGVALALLYGAGPAITD